MPIKIGSTNISAIYIGTTPIAGVYIGTTQVFSAYPPISITGAGAYYSSGAVGGFPRNKSVTTSLSVSGGTGSYTYSWSLLSGDAVTVSNTSALNPTFSKSLAADESSYSTYRLTVTSGSQTALYDVVISLSN